ncbi:MAG: 16S rRNA (cytidine(1402)-2'-O)-methyltransferase [Bacteroidales bacterium]|nr:16S rRNA (cytidine(1402)-2'-O)-methyltransferase [Bacteroidales bacterium]
MAKLYVVPTPVGNLEDITRRAIRVLQEVDLILAEDTRKGLNLLRHFGIEKQVVSYHKDNEHRMVPSILGRLQEGQTLALISEAGMPGISDPGYLLIRACIEQDIAVESLPGPTAFVPALVNSGLPCDRFFFEGFLPAKKGRNKRLKEICHLPHTVVLYESPHRLLRTLKDLHDHLGKERNASISKEISKIHETTFRGTLGELLEQFEGTKPKGEYVIIVAGVTK